MFVFEAIAAKIFKTASFKDFGHLHLYTYIWAIAFKKKKFYCLCTQDQNALEVNSNGSPYGLQQWENDSIVISCKIPKNEKHKIIQTEN